MTAQMQMRAHPGTDAEKIVDALRAEPGFISNGGDNSRLAGNIGGSISCAAKGNQ